MKPERATVTEITPRAIDTHAILNALADATLVIDAAGVVRYANAAAEQLFGAGAAQLYGRRLDALIPRDSPALALLDQVRHQGGSVSESDVTIETPRIGTHRVTLHAASLTEPAGMVVLSLREQSIVQRIDHQLIHRGAARSVAALAATLGHEVKNPLSGIRGAAQLLEQGARPEDRALARLICEETDRIRALVDRMEAFSDERPIAREPVNIHEVLDRVRSVAENGFARHARFVESYDPSLPPVHGNRDLLIQVFLNLVKNAAEAVPETGGEITLSTAYQHGVRLALAGRDRRQALPIVVGVADNGAGIPEVVRAHLFEAFVTTKVNGSGLGLALVAKLVSDHGGAVECESVPRRTAFRVLLPVSDQGEGTP
ncbi:MAG: ATP-binding protein [Alphaproteobacteria bacterium]